MDQTAASSGPRQESLARRMHFHPLRFWFLFLLWLVAFAPYRAFTLAPSESKAKTRPASANAPAVMARGREVLGDDWTATRPLPVGSRSMALDRRRSLCANDIQWVGARKSSGHVNQSMVPRVLAA
jgi:hypothetical protein